MDRAEVIRRLKENEPKLRALGVGSLYLFGSYARDEAGPKSDVDVFVDPADEEMFDLLTFCGSSQIVEDAFPEVPVSYSKRDQIALPFLASVEAGAIQVF